MNLNFKLEEVLVYPFTYTKEMEAIYEFYENYINIKENKTNVVVKKKTRGLSLR